MKKQILCTSLYILFCLLLLSCPDTTHRSFEIRNTNWEGAGPNTNNRIRLEFNNTTVKVTYETQIYPDMPYRYHARYFQGSIFVQKFEYADGSAEDVMWLFTLAQNTSTLLVNLFIQQDKSRNKIYLAKEV